jgi:hypothetical protein
MTSIQSLAVAALVAVSVMAGKAQETDVLIDLGNPEPAQLLSPPNNVPLASTTEQFVWSAGSEVQWYWVWIGTGPNQADLVSQSMGLETSLTVQQLPINGKPIYLTLFSYIGGKWQSQPYVYATASPSAIAKMITPADGSTLPGSTVTFKWSPATGAQQYWIYAGSQPGGNNLLSQSAALSTVFTMSNLPTTGQPLYITLWTLTGGAWQSASYHYVTGSGGTVQVVPALAYDYYEQQGMDVLPDFSTMTPVKSGTVNNFDLSIRNRDNDFAVRYTGYIRIDATGDYTFYSASDDGTQLSLDGKPLVNNDGIHGTVEQSATKTLAAGYHQITLTYFQGPGGFFLDVQWSGPAINKQHIPNGLLFHAITTK